MWKCWKVSNPSNWTGQHLLCDLMLYFLRHLSWLQFGIHLGIQVKLWQILWQFYQNIFLCSLACESFYSKSGYLCPDWSWVGIWDSPVKSGQSRLIWDAWTLCKGFLGGRGGSGACSPKNWNLRSSSCWKCIEIVYLTITLLFLYNFKYFTIPSGRPFWLLGGGGVRAHPAHPSLPTGLLHVQFGCVNNDNK